MLITSRKIASTRQILGPTEHLKFCFSVLRAKPRLNQGDGVVGHINANPLTAKSLSGLNSGPATTERVQNNIAGIR